jgi:hypothetical protein
LCCGLSIDFETVSDAEAVTNQIATEGGFFSDTTAIVVGGSLNEFALPLHSGTTPLFNDGGLIVLSFPNETLVSIGGFFPYGIPLTVTACSALDPQDPRPSSSARSPPRFLRTSPFPATRVQSHGVYHKFEL